MNRTRLLRLRRNRRETSFRPAGADGETTWIEWFGDEMRLTGEGGACWSRALPNATQGMSRLEFGANEMDAFDQDDEETWHEHA